MSIIGTGKLGSVVATLAAQAGLDVFISNSRGPDTLLPFAAGLGANVHPVTITDACDASELVVLSIPFARYFDMPAEHLVDRTVVDATNFIPHRDMKSTGSIFNGLTPSGGLQKHLYGSKVVKALSNVSAGHLLSLARPRAAVDRSALPIASDYTEAKSAATEFLDRIGWDAVDVGALDDSAFFGVGSPVFVKAYMEDPSGTGEQWGPRIATDPGAPLNSAAVRALVARYRKAPRPEKNRRSND